MFWLHRRLLYFEFYRKILLWSRGYVLPGFYPIPLYPIVKFFVAELSKEELLNKASSLAYNFLLAVFPGIIFLFTLIPFIPAGTGFQKQLLETIHLILPENAYKAFHITLLDIVSKPNPGLLSVGFIIATFFATNGVSNLMGAFNKASLEKETRTWWHRRGIAILLTFIMSFSIIVCLGVITAGEFVINYLKENEVINEHLKTLGVYIVRWLLLVALYFSNVVLLYRYIPINGRKWRVINPGVILATSLAFITIVAFSFYVNYFNSYNKLYGSIGTLVVVMVWLYLNALILLIGFELNASIDISKRTIRMPKIRTNNFKS